MERLLNVAIIHFVITGLSFLGFGALPQDGSSLLGTIFKTIVRFITIPARQVANAMMSEPGLVIWLFYILNSFLWAVVIVKIWSWLDKQRGKGGAG